MKNVLIADDYSIIRVGLKSIVRKNYDTGRLDEADDESGIINRIKKTRYDLIILDINMRNLDFVKTIEWISITSHTTNLLVFSGHEEQTYGLKCLTLGATGYLNKACTIHELTTAIRDTMEGRRHMSPALANLLVDIKKTETIDNPFIKLSPRELEIALFFDKGLTLPKICAMLNIHYSTGSTYKKRIWKKLDINNVLSLSRLMSAFSIAQ